MFVEHVVVDDFECEGSGDRLQLITWREHTQVLVGVCHEVAERETLSHGAELLAVGRTKELVQSCPLQLVGLSRFKPFVERGSAFDATLVSRKARVDL